MKMRTSAASLQGRTSDSAKLTQDIGDDVEVDKLVSGSEDVGREVDESEDIEGGSGRSEAGDDGEGSEGEAHAD